MMNRRSNEKSSSIQYTNPIITEHIKSNIKEKFFGLSQDASFQCFPKIIEALRKKPNHFLCVLWSIIFITLTGLTAWIVSTSIIEYSNFETVTKIEVIDDPISDFPTVTICDTNVFTTKFAEDLFLNMSLEIHGVDIRTLEFTNDFNEKQKMLVDLAKLRVSNANFTSLDKKRLGFSIDCNLNGLTFDDKPESKPKDHFKWLFSYDYGNCLQFNSGFNYSDHKISIKKTQIQGPKYGLKLVITNMTYMNTFPTSDSHGIVIFIHDKTQKSRAEEEIHVKKGEWTNIAIKRTLTQKFPYPYSNCVDLNSGKICDKKRSESKLFKHTIDLAQEYNKRYRQQDCFDLCLQKIINIKCKCYSTKFSNLDKNLPPCYSLSDMKCILEQKENSIHENYPKCMSDCPSECDWTNFDFQVSSSSFPTKELYKIINSTGHYFENYKTFEEFKNDYLTVNIYYPYTKYTRISELPKVTLFGLFSNIGGSLGIFLGYTLFSFIEIFVILVELICFYFNSRNNNSPVVFHRVADSENSVEPISMLKNEQDQINDNSL